MPQNTLPALEIYRRSFTPSATLAAPYASIGVAVVCAETDENARWLHGLVAAVVPPPAQRPAGHAPLPGGGGAFDYSPDQLEFIDSWTSSHVVGSPATVREGLLELQRTTAADELMLTTNVYDHPDRLRSYELVADALASAETRAA